jgi:hypothetical protein
MSKHKVTKLYMNQESDGPELLGFKNRYVDKSRPANPEEETLEAMAQLLDEQAENCNAHDFVCCHRGLAAILNQEVGRESATKVMRRLVNYEGLYGLVGVCGKGDVENAEKELKVPLNGWGDWSLT